MPKKGSRDVVARVSVGIAIGSLLVNALQFYTASQEQRRKHQDEDAERMPKAFFAYANDETLWRLYRNRINLKNEPEMSEVSVRHGSQADLQIQSWLERTDGAGAVRRNKPTASFLVVGGRADGVVRSLRAFVRHGTGVADTVLLATSHLNPKQYVLVPLDFRAPGNDFAEPNTPSQVIIEFGDPKASFSVRPTDRIDWLGTQFFRGLVRSAAP